MIKKCERKMAGKGKMPGKEKKGGKGEKGTRKVKDRGCLSNHDGTFYFNAWS